jgi:RNA polymerase subunit RPABC4/transcription elongation factor Spt4
MTNATMTTCPDCGASVSKRATACPSCGAPQKAATNTGTRVIFRTVALLAAILAALVAWSSYNVDSTAAASNAAVWGGISGISLFCVYPPTARLNHAIRLPGACKGRGGRKLYNLTPKDRTPSAFTARLFSGVGENWGSGIRFALAEGIA